MLWLGWDGGRKICSVIHAEAGEDRNLLKSLEYLQLPGWPYLGGKDVFILTWVS